MSLFIHFSICKTYYALSDKGGYHRARIEKNTISNSWQSTTGKVSTKNQSGYRKSRKKRNGEHGGSVLSESYIPL